MSDRRIIDHTCGYCWRRQAIDVTAWVEMVQRGAAFVVRTIQCDYCAFAAVVRIAPDNVSITAGAA